MHATPIDAGTAHDLRIIRAIVTDLVNGRGIRVWLFGSHARGDARRFSDVDIALLSEGERRIPAEVMIDLREAFEEALVLRRVDLVDLATVDESFRQRVEREGVLWVG
jgi:uncharacterized protein